MLRNILILPLLTFFFLFDLAFGYSERTEVNENSFTPRKKVSLSALSIETDFESFAPLDLAIDRFIRQWGVTGASIAVAKDGRLVYAKGYGFSNKEDEVPMHSNHILRVASVSKLITAVAVMKLVEDGKLNLYQKVFGKKGILNDRVYSDYIDERVEQITVKQLLNHSAGWTTRWGDHLFMHESIARQLNKELPLSNDDIIGFALAKRLHFEPGTRSSYNNIGYLVLEKIIEKTSGRPYEAFVSDNIFKPLGIFDAFIAHNYDSLRYPAESRYYEVPEAELVPAYDGQQKLVLKSRGGNDIRTLGAAGGWVISSVSLVKFLMAIDPENEDGIISSKLANLLSQAEPGLQPLGWRWVSNDGSKWRTGSFAGTSALAISRSDGITFAFITNTSPWVGARFPYEVNRMMTRALQRVEQWPEVDLLKPQPLFELNFFENFFKRD